MDIYIDADGCPVKEEVYRVARRLGLRVFVVSDRFMRTPDEELIRAVAVKKGPDAADDWIAGEIARGDVAVTSDIPLASRCVKKGARVVTPKGRILDESNVGEALSTRNLMDQIRETGEITGGPAPMTQKDRSRFLSRLDEVIQKLMREEQVEDNG